MTIQQDEEIMEWLDSNISAYDSEDLDDALMSAASHQNFAPNSLLLAHEERGPYRRPECRGPETRQGCSLSSAMRALQSKCVFSLLTS